MKFEIDLCIQTKDDLPNIGSSICSSFLCAHTPTKFTFFQKR